MVYSNMTNGVCFFLWFKYIMNLFLIVLYLYVCINLFLDIFFTDEQEQLTGSPVPYISYVRKLLSKVFTALDMKESHADFQAGFGLIGLFSVNCAFSETTQITQSSNSKTETPRRSVAHVASPLPFSDPPFSPVCAHLHPSSSLSCDWHMSTVPLMIRQQIEGS